MSREKKRQINWYQINDGEAIAAHLEKMAAKGWMLEKAGNWGWTFYKAEPRQVHYCITYFPDASIFDASPTDGQETYFDYCQAAGWEFVSALGPVQYFRSTLPNPVPIETDESEKLTAIHRTMRKSILASYGLLLAAQCLNLWSQWNSLRLDPLEGVSDPIQMGARVMVILLAVFLAGNLADYLIWYFRSRRSVARGGGCKKVHTKARMLAVGVLLAVSTLVLLYYIASLTTPGWRMVLLYSFGGMALILALVMGVLRLMKRRGAARENTRTVYWVLVAVLSVVYAAGMMPLAAHLIDTGAMVREPAYTYTSQYGADWRVYQDDLPVTLEDLGFQVTEADHCSYEAEISRSLLARSAVYSQRPVGNNSQLPWLEYQVCVIRWDWLRNWCWKALHDRYTWAQWQNVTPAPWGAEAAYQWKDRSNYLLLYKDRIVCLYIDCDLTENQGAQLVAALME